MSKVWVTSNWVYKDQHEFFTDNEIYFYRAMYHTGYVPYAEQIDRSLIKIEFIELEEITDASVFLSHLEPVLQQLESVGIRHGDLTEYAIRIKDDKPYLIDFSESRFMSDPRPDKRTEGDKYWLTKTMHKLASNSTNKRFPEQIAIVSSHVDFAGKSVLDLGCGYGDMLKAAYEAHASKVIGVDSDINVLRAVRADTADSGIRLINDDIDDVLTVLTPFDIIICFSVLPYVDDINSTLDAISKSCKTALLEIQYKDDGNGKIKDDLEAKELLSNYFDSVKPIGKTLVDYRNKYRTIWLCE